MAAAPNLPDEQFARGYISDFLDGELSGDSRARMEKLLSSGDHADLEKQFKNLRGRLQLTLQGYYLKEDELNKLKALVEDPTIRATHEAEKIEQIERREFSGNLMRRVVLIGVVLGLILLLVWVFAPPPKVNFEPLENLGYEALALQEDPTDRLDLPTNDLGEIRNYLERYPGLRFSPKVLNITERFVPQGAAMIDYEVAKVSLVYWSTNDGEGLFHFSYAGSIGDLPKAEPGKRGPLTYQTYASDQLNIIAWQHTDGVVSMLAGYQSALNLADLAIKGGAVTQ